MATQLPTLQQMMEAGMHFGHSKSKRYPKMQSFIHSTRSHIDIINLDTSALMFKTALDFVEKIVAQGGTILWVGTKKQAVPIIDKYAQKTETPYVTGRWLGGTFTNFQSVINLTKELKHLEDLLASETSRAKYVKKELVKFEKQVKKLIDSVGGIRNMNKLPQAVVVLDTKREKTVIREAKKLCIPVVALLDSNVNPDLVQYGVPGNDDAIKSIELFCSKVAEAIEEGKRSRKEKLIK